ncbi:MAG: hypothetical protein ACK50Y_01200 [Flavobacteriia bacterium]
MAERVMAVSGAFATHTTKLYNYYVCPTGFDLNDVEYLAVNYMNELKYLGKIIEGPLLGNYSGEENFIGLNLFSEPIQVDLREFRCKLRVGDFQLIILEPIIGACNQLNLQYTKKGAFVNNIQKKRYFDNLAEFFSAHQEL